jgi:hypothetical protein
MIWRIALRHDMHDELIYHAYHTGEADPIHNVIFLLPKNSKYEQFSFLR